MIQLIGILNVTRDSFSDGGRFLDPEAALEHARRLVADGADIIDVGAESTRPGSDRVPAREQIARLKLKAMGVKIDKLTKEQKKYLTSWDMGT